MNDNHKLIAAVVAGLLMMAKGCEPPGPEPKPPVVATVREAFDDYRELMGKVWTEGASQSFDSDRAAFEWVKSRAELARKAAFAPVHEREQATIGGEKYSEPKRQELWRTFASETQ